MTISEALEYAGEEFGLTTEEALDFLEKIVRSQDFEELIVALTTTSPCCMKETA